jgi:AcrR family transcriptional regulator
VPTTDAPAPPGVPAGAGSAHAAAPSGRRAAALPPGERRATIVAAVLPLLVEHGERVTTRQIAEAAGIAEGTIFRVFADKDELLTAALEAALDQAPLERALASIDPTAPFEQRLVAATEIIERRIADVWAVVSHLGPKLRQLAQRPLPSSDALTALFEPERDRLRLPPASAARLLRALTLSLTHPMLAGEPASSDEIVSIVLHGIEARP